MTTVRPPQPLLDKQAVELVDHVLPASAKVVLVEYGDYETTATTQASGAVRQILEASPSARIVPSEPTVHC